MSARIWRTQALLAVGLLLVGTLAYWWEYSFRPKKQEAETNEKKLFGLKGRPIQTLEIVFRPATGSTKRVVLQCVDADAKKCAAEQQGDWSLVEPLKTKADKSNMSMLLSSVSSLMASDTVRIDDETAEKQAQLLKDYELDEGSKAVGSRVVIAYQDGTKETVWLGAVHPNGDKQYALSSESKLNIPMVPTHFKSNLDREVTYWRDKRIVQFTVFDVQKLDLRSPKGNVLGEKNDGVWTVQQKGPSSQGRFAGDFENIESLLSAASSLQATAFSEKSILNSAKQEVALELTMKDQKTYRIKLFENAKTKKAYVTADPSPVDLGTVFEVNAAIKDRLNKGLRDLRLSKLITSVERYSIKKIDIQSGGKSMGLEHKDAKWLLSHDAKAQDAPNESVTAILDALSGNRIQDFLSVGSLSTAAQAARKSSMQIQLQGEGATVQKKFVFWKVDKTSELFAIDLLSNRKDEVFKVDFAIAAKLPWDVQSFK